MPPKTQKEAPLTPELTDRLNDLTARHLSTDPSEPATTVEEWKNLGNACFSHGSFLTAIKCYTKAIADMAGGDTAVLRSNRSAAYLKSSMFSGPALALKDAERAVELEPSWFKAHLRLGDAQFVRKRFDEAEAAYDTALRLDPTCSAAAASRKEVVKERFLRDLDAQDRERRRAEEEACEQLRETEAYATAAAAAAAMGDPDAGSGRPTNATARSAGAGGDVRDDPAAPTAAPSDHTDGARKPLEFHNAPLRFGGAGEESELLLPSGLPRPRGLPTEEETAELIRTWKRDLVPREEADESTGAATHARHAASLSGSGGGSVAAGEGLGRSYKERLMGEFRSKVEADEDFSATLRQRREEERRRGEKVDYREADRYRKIYAKSTNGIGLGISADAYKEHLGVDRSRW